MEDPAQSQSSGGSETHYPPGVRPPTAAERLQSPDHVAKRNAGLQAFNALPLEEKRRRRAEKEAAKVQRAAEKLARQMAANGAAVAPSEASPDTVRSARGSSAKPPAAAPDTPRRRVFVTKPRTLLDLLDLFNLDGQTFIQVTRTAPKTFQGFPVAGVQRPIWESIDDHEFAAIYGGEAYDLRVYRISDDGKRPQALSETVSYRVAGAPNLDSAPNDEEDVPAMQPNRSAPAFMRPGRLTHPSVANAEADILKTQLAHEETMDERKERRAREEEDRRERKIRERSEREEEGKLDTAKLMAEQRREEMERMDRARERELEMVRQTQGNESKLTLELLKNIGQRGGGEESKALIQQHAQELRQLSENHKEEMLRLTEAHKETLERVTLEHQKILQRAEDNHRTDRQRLEDQVRQTDQRAAESVKEAERRAEARVTDLREESRRLIDDITRRGEERLRDQNTGWQQRFDDLKTNHDRELRSKDSEINMMRTNLEGTTKVLLDQKDMEIKRLERDLREKTREAEENKDWLGKMSEFEETAEKMGMSRDSGKAEGEDKDETLGSIALKAGMNALTRLPETIGAIGQTISAARGGGGPNEAARQQARSVAARPMRSVPRTAPHQAPRLAFATEESNYVHAPDHTSASSAPSQVLRPLPPEDPQPLQDFHPAAAPAREPQQQDAVPALQSANPVHAPEPQVQVQQQVQQQPATTPAPEQQNQAPVATIDPAAVPDDQVLVYMPMLRDFFTSGHTPIAVAKHLVESQSKEACAYLLQAVSYERITALAAMHPNEGGMQLNTRDGKKFVRELWIEIAKEISKAD